MWNVKVNREGEGMHLHSEVEGTGLDILEEMEFAVADTLDKIKVPKELFMLFLLKHD